MKCECGCKLYNTWKFCPMCSKVAPDSKVKPTVKTMQERLDYYITRWGKEQADYRVRTCVRVGESYEDWVRRVGSGLSVWQCTSQYYAGGSHMDHYTLPFIMCDYPGIENTDVYAKVRYHEHPKEELLRVARAHFTIGTTEYYEFNDWINKLRS